MIGQIIASFQSWRDRRKQVGKWMDCRQINQPCGACAHCVYTGEIKQKTRLFEKGLAVMQYFYCGITGKELTREQAFYKSDCAHWTPYIVLANTKQEPQSIKEDNP